MKNTSKDVSSGYTELVIYNMKVAVQEHSTGASPEETHYTNHAVELDYKWLITVLKRTSLCYYQKWSSHFKKALYFKLNQLSGISPAKQHMQLQHKKTIACCVLILVNGLVIKQ